MRPPAGLVEVMKSSTAHVTRLTDDGYINYDIPVPTIVWKRLLPPQAPVVSLRSWTPSYYDADGTPVLTMDPPRRRR